MCLLVSERQGQEGQKRSRKRYFVDDPVIVLGLADFERLITGIRNSGQIADQSPPEKRRIHKENAALIEESLLNIKRAKAFYYIK